MQSLIMAEFALRADGCRRHPRCFFETLSLLDRKWETNDCIKKVSILFVRIRHFFNVLLCFLLRNIF